MADAIPSWTQPKMREGNWDEVRCIPYFSAFHPLLVEKLLPAAFSRPFLAFLAVLCFGVLGGGREGRVAFINA